MAKKFLKALSYVERGAQIYAGVAAAGNSAGKAAGKATKPPAGAGKKAEIGSSGTRGLSEDNIKSFEGSFADQRPAAEGGVSKATTKKLRDHQQYTGRSALVKAQGDIT